MTQPSAPGLLFILCSGEETRKLALPGRGLLAVLREGLTLVIPRLLQFYACRGYSFSQPVGWVWFCFFRVAAALLQAVQERVDFILYSVRSGSQQQRRLLPSKVEYTCFYVSSTSFGEEGAFVCFLQTAHHAEYVSIRKKGPRYPSVSDFCRGTAAL